MRAIEKKIVHQCAIALSSLPGKNNAMSGYGAAQYHVEMREAIALNNRALLCLLDSDIEQAQRYANDLVSLVLQVLLREGLSVTAAMESLRSNLDELQT